jgi:hypothetical protein
LIISALPAVGWMGYVVVVEATGRRRWADLGHEVPGVLMNAAATAPITSYITTIFGRVLVMVANANLITMLVGRCGPARRGRPVGEGVCSKIRGFSE